MDRIFAKFEEMERLLRIMIKEKSGREYEEILAEMEEVESDSKSMVVEPDVGITESAAVPEEDAMIEVDSGIDELQEIKSGTQLLDETKETDSEPRCLLASESPGILLNNLSKDSQNASITLDIVLSNTWSTESRDEVVGVKNLGHVFTAHQVFDQMFRCDQAGHLYEVSAMAEFPFEPGLLSLVCDIMVIGNNSTPILDQKIIAVLKSSEMRPINDSQVFFTAINDGMGMQWLDVTLTKCPDYCGELLLNKNSRGLLIVESASYLIEMLVQSHIFYKIKDVESEEYFAYNTVRNYYMTLTDSIKGKGNAQGLCNIRELEDKAVQVQCDSEGSSEEDQDLLLLDNVTRSFDPGIVYPYVWEFTVLQQPHAIVQLKFLQNCCLRSLPRDSRMQRSRQQFLLAPTQSWFNTTLAMQRGGVKSANGVTLSWDPGIINCTQEDVLLHQFKQRNRLTTAAIEHWSFTRYLTTIMDISAGLASVKQQWLRAVDRQICSIILLVAHIYTQKFSHLLLYEYVWPSWCLNPVLEAYWVRNIPVGEYEYIVEPEFEGNSKFFRSIELTADLTRFWVDRRLTLDNEGLKNKSHMSCIPYCDTGWDTHGLQSEVQWNDVLEGMGIICGAVRTLICGRRRQDLVEVTIGSIQYSIPSENPVTFLSSPAMSIITHTVQQISNSLEGVWLALTGTSGIKFEPGGQVGYFMNSGDLGYKEEEIWMVWDVSLFSDCFFYKQNGDRLQTEGESIASVIQIFLMESATKGFSSSPMCAFTSGQVWHFLDTYILIGEDIMDIKVTVTAKFMSDERREDLANVMDPTGSEECFELNSVAATHHNEDDAFDDHLERRIVWVSSGNNKGVISGKAISSDVSSKLKPQAPWLYSYQRCLLYGECHMFLWKCSTVMGIQIYEMNADSKIVMGWQTSNIVLTRVYILGATTIDLSFTMVGCPSMCGMVYLGSHIVAFCMGYCSGFILEDKDV